MCMIVNINRPKAGSRRIRWRKDATATCWKVYNVRQFHLTTLYHRHQPVAPGWIVSNRRHQEVGMDGSDNRPTSYSQRLGEVGRGIHVFRTRKRAKGWAARFPSGVVVPVKCRRGDLVAVGCSDAEAVFMKVHLAQKDYDKAMGEPSP